MKSGESNLLPLYAQISKAYCKVCVAFYDRSITLKQIESISRTDKQNALRRECTFKIEIVQEIGVAGVNNYFKITVLALSDVLHGAQTVRPWRIVIDFYQ